MRSTRPPPRLSIEQIQTAVARHCRVTLPDLISARRTADVVRLRQIARFLAKNLTPNSLPVIGRIFGGRDHTTVLHAVRKIEALRMRDKNLGCRTRRHQARARGTACLGPPHGSVAKYETSVIHQQVEFAPKLVMDREDGPIDIADKAVAKNDTRDLPIAAATDIRQRVQAGNHRGCASGLIAQRLVGEFGQFHHGLSNGRQRVLQLGSSINRQSTKRACVARAAVDVDGRHARAS
jgi:hypothetical protein